MKYGQISRGKGNQAMKFGQVMGYNNKNFLLQKRN